MGAWYFIEPKLRKLLGTEVGYSGRDASASPATGSLAIPTSADSELAAGAVVAVEPGAGTLLRVPAAVLVTLSRGPALVPMPYLLGIPQQEAIDSLTGLGFRLLAVDTVFRFGRDQGLVVEQDPPADSLLAPQSMVRLSVGRRGG